MKQTREFSLKREELAHALFCVEHLRRSLIDSGVRKIGIPRTQHRTLMYLSCKGKLFSQKELAEHLSVTPAAITGILKSLENEGYIVRCALKEDNRFREIEITEKGREVVEETKAAFDSADKIAFADFDENDFETMLTLISRIRCNIEKAKEETPL